jgi:hypothetical protein
MTSRPKGRRGAVAPDVSGPGAEAGIQPAVRVQSVNSLPPNPPTDYKMQQDARWCGLQVREHGDWMCVDEDSVGSIS